MVTVLVQLVQLMFRLLHWWDSMCGCTSTTRRHNFIANSLIIWLSQSFHLFNNSPKDVVMFVNAFIRTDLFSISSMSFSWISNNLKKHIGYVFLLVSMHVSSQYTLLMVWLLFILATNTIVFPGYAIIYLSVDKRYFMCFLIWATMNKSVIFVCIYAHIYI